jgi:hypothetical protein
MFLVFSITLQLINACTRIVYTGIPRRQPPMTNLMQPEQRSLTRNRKTAFSTVSFVIATLPC